LRTVPVVILIVPVSTPLTHIAVHVVQPETVGLIGADFAGPPQRPVEIGLVVYGIMYFGLVVAFTYFYTTVTFEPTKVGENLQKQGGYIPGVRPGRSTAEYLAKILNRITLAGALFLGTIAVLPYIIQGFTHIQTMSIGGTSLLIAVSVALDSMKQIDSQLVMRDYDGFLKG